MFARVCVCVCTFPSMNYDSNFDYLTIMKRRKAMKMLANILIMHVECGIDAARHRGIAEVMRQSCV